MGGEVLSTGGHNISGLQRDNSAVRVSHQAGGEDAIDTDRVDSTASSGVSDLGSVDLGGVGGHDGAVVVSDQTVRGIGGVGVGVDIVADEAEVGGTGGGDLKGVGGDHGAVGVGDQGLSGAQGDTGGENLRENTVKYFLDLGDKFFLTMFWTNIFCNS